MTQSEMLSYAIERSDDMWVIEIYDGITVEILKNLIAELATLQVPYRLWVVPTALDFGTDLVHGLSMFAIAQEYRSQISAVVCPHDVTFGIARMFESLAEVNGQNMRVFREKEDALSWLGHCREEQRTGA